MSNIDIHAGNPMIRTLFTVLSLAALVACGSSVKLDDVPVEDRAASPVAATPLPPSAVAAPASASTAGGSEAASRNDVARVDLTRPAGSAAAPVGSNLIYFDYDSYVVKPEFANVIEAHARFLRADRNRKAAIEGHTDERGGREYNLALGQRRAEAVRRALGLLGVPDAQLEAVSFGKEKPAVQGSSDDAMARNRRAEIVYR